MVDRVVLVNGVKISLAAAAWLYASQNKCMPAVTVKIDGQEIATYKAPSGNNVVFLDGIIVLYNTAEYIIQLLKINENNLYPNGNEVIPLEERDEYIAPSIRVVVDRGRKQAALPNGSHRGGRLLSSLVSSFRAMKKDDYLEYNICRQCANHSITGTSAIFVGKNQKRQKPFGTLIVDPPWPYESAKYEAARGYSVEEYSPLSLEELCKLRLSMLADYLFLWTTPAFDANGGRKLIRSWGFVPITTMYWVKMSKVLKGGRPDIDGNGFRFSPNYGVGYWFRGVVEPIICCKIPKIASIRSAWMGIICENAGHSRKPESLYDIIESEDQDIKYPSPYCEVFARGHGRPKWTRLGLEAAGDGTDIRSDDSYLAKILDRWYKPL